MRNFNILIIDDEEPRHKWFQEILGDMGHRVYEARTAQEALNELSDREFDVVFFDHDYGEKYNGSEVAGRILNDPNYWIPRAVLVHSMNYNGAQNIASKFRSAGVPVIIESYLNLQECSNLKGVLEELVPDRG